MTSIKRNPKLTNRDMDILNIPWNFPNSMTAFEITNVKNGLTINTIQTELRKLLKQKLVEMADIAYSENVLCQSYRATVSAEEIALSHFANESSKISPSFFVAALLDTKTDREAREDNPTPRTCTAGLQERFGSVIFQMVKLHKNSLHKVICADSTLA